MGYFHGKIENFIYPLNKHTVNGNRKQLLNKGADDNEKKTSYKFLRALW